MEKNTEFKLVKITANWHKPYYNIYVDDGIGQVQQQSILDRTIDDTNYTGTGYPKMEVSEEYAISEFDKFVDDYYKCEHNREVIKLINK